MRSTFIRTLTDIARGDASVMLLTGDLGFTVFEPFAKEFPDRFLNMGVAEQNMVGVAAGLALSGRKVFVYSIIPFATLRCLEHIRNDLCYQHLPVCIVGVGSGYSYGHMGPTHHALEDIAAMRALPGMTVLCPGDPAETEGAVRAIAKHDGPCYLRLGKNGEPVLHERKPDFAIGRTFTLRKGADVAILATGTMVETALKTADLLSSEKKLRATVLSVPTVAPMDPETIRSLAKSHPLLVTIEEHRKAGGFGSAVAELLADLSHRPPHLLCTATDDIGHLCGDTAFLREKSGLTPELIAGRIFSALSRP